MGDLTTNFSRHEFACKCGCGLDTIDYKLVKILQETVDHFSKIYMNVKAYVSSGNRCVPHNKREGGSTTSFHIVCKASDFTLTYETFSGTREMINPASVYAYLDEKYSDSLGLGIYNNRVHMDVRETKARWDKR